MKKILFLISLTIFINGVSFSQNDCDLCEQWKKNVVKISAKFSDGSDESGFGIIVGESGDKLNVATAAHVVYKFRNNFKDPDTKTEQVKIKFFTEQGIDYDATLLNLPSNRFDLTLIQIPKPAGFSWTKDFYSTAIKRGTTVWFIGRDGRWYVPIGPAVGAIDEISYDDEISISINSISPGTSGAPLISEKGVVGIIFEDAASGAKAYPIEKVKQIISDWNYPWQLNLNTNNLENTLKPEGNNIVSKSNTTKSDLDNNQTDPSSLAEQQMLKIKEELNIADDYYIKENFEGAAEIYLRNGEALNANQQFNLGLMYYEGNGVLEDDSIAIIWFRKAADQGSSQAQKYLGVMYDYGYGVPVDDAEALLWYRKAADQGLIDAQLTLAFMYDDGIGVHEDDAEAVFWYRKAADQGLLDAQLNLGIMYDNGTGVPEDDAQAVFWYRKAADQGSPDAQYNLGVMYDEGAGVPEDDAEAVIWYRKAADQGVFGAQFNLGIMYDEGTGVPEDDAEAIIWYRKAADQGFSDAQLNLGIMYDEGTGVPEDDAEAIIWYRRAADQGNIYAKEKLDALENKTTDAIVETNEISLKIELVTYVEYTKGNETGTFEQTGSLEWKETNSDGVFLFQENTRDEWSIYLVADGKLIRLDLFKKEIFYNNVLIYKIKSYQNKPFQPKTNPTSPNINKENSGGSAEPLNLEAALRRDGLINGNNIKLKYNNGILYINGKKQSEEISKKYSNYSIW